MVSSFLIFFQRLQCEGSKAIGTVSLVTIYPDRMVSLVGPHTWQGMLTPTSQHQRCDYVYQMRLLFLYPSRPSADVPLKECLAYGEVRGSRQVVEGRGGGGGEEEAHISEPTDLAMEGRGAVGDYEN